MIIAIAFVLFIPVTGFAQEDSRNMMEEYCLKNLQDDPQCENYTPKLSEENKVNYDPTKIKENKSSNPIEEFIQFFIQIFQGINPEETVKDVTKELSLDSVQNTVESTIDDISDSIPIDMSSISGNSEAKLEDCSKYKREIRDGTDMEEAFIALEKTKACEQRNNQIVMQQDLEDTAKLENVSLQPVPNKIQLSHAEGKFTPSNLIFVEHPKFHEIKFTVTVSLDIAYDQVTRVDQSNLFLIDENSKKYHILVGLCGPVLDWINGRNTDTVSFMGCYDVGKDVHKLDIMYKSYGPSSTNVKIGTIQIKN